MKGPVYLKNKDGQVIYVQKFKQIEWTGGCLEKTDRSIIVQSLFGTQTYTLLDHITVRNLKFLHVIYFTMYIEN